MDEDMEGKTHRERERERDRDRERESQFCGELRTQSDVVGAHLGGIHVNVVPVRDELVVDHVRCDPRVLVRRPKVLQKRLLELPRVLLDDLATALAKDNHLPHM